MGFRAVLAMELVLGMVASCTDSAATTGADASADASLDAPIADRLGAGVDVSLDAVVADRLGAGVDASLDAPVADRFGAAVDVRIARTDVSPSWGDVPRVDVDGTLLPINPNATPAPGSECTSGASMRPGDPMVSPPRPVRPLSVSRVTSQRPTFQWVLADGTTGARVEMCADRCCTRVLQTIDAEGTTVRPMAALPPGMVFWRMFGRSGSVVGSRASYTWEFEVRRRDAPMDTTWGTIRDFNGDGFDDALMFRRVSPLASSREILLVPGSAGGLSSPVSTGVATESDGYAAVGDFNGDGIADVAWSDREAQPSVVTWYSIMLGARDRAMPVIQLDITPFGNCAETKSAGVVDWNGDGYSDLMIAVGFGCNGTVGPNEPSVLFGYLGSSAGLVPVPQWGSPIGGIFNNPRAHVSQETSLSDLDLDGYGDMFIFSEYSGQGPVVVHPQQAVLHGGVVGRPRIERISVPFREPRFHEGLSALGDLDGDGLVEFGLRDALNYTVLVYSPGRGWSSPVATLTDPLNGYYFGYSLSSGDINGDGLSDVIASSGVALIRHPGADPTWVGRVYAFPGPVVSGEGSLWVERPVVQLDDSTLLAFGTESISPGDINGDGVDDVVMVSQDRSALCERFGRARFSSGPPDRCTENVAPIWTRLY